MIEEGTIWVDMSQHPLLNKIEPRFLHLSGEENVWFFTKNHWHFMGRWNEIFKRNENIEQRNKL